MAEQTPEEELAPVPPFTHVSWDRFKRMRMRSQEEDPAPEPLGNFAWDPIRGYNHIWDRPYRVQSQEEMDALDSEQPSEPWWVKNAQDPATRTQWVLIGPCGCAQGVLEGTEAENAILALGQFYESMTELEAALKAGVQIRMMSHQRYAALYSEHLSSNYVCPHKPKVKF